MVTHKSAASKVYRCYTWHPKVNLHTLSFSEISTRGLKGCQRRTMPSKSMSGIAISALLCIGLFMWALPFASVSLSPRNQLTLTVKICGDRLLCINRSEEETWEWLSNYWSKELTQVFLTSKECHHYNWQVNFTTLMIQKIMTLSNKFVNFSNLMDSWMSLSCYASQTNHWKRITTLCASTWSFFSAQWFVTVS